MKVKMIRMALMTFTRRVKKNNTRTKSIPIMIQLPPLPQRKISTVKTI
jgi:hypothetical protein